MISSRRHPIAIMGAEKLSDVLDGQKSVAITPQLEANARRLAASVVRLRDRRTARLAVS